MRLLDERARLDEGGRSFLVVLVIQAGEMRVFHFGIYSGRRALLAHSVLAFTFSSGLHVCLERLGREQAGGLQRDGQRVDEDCGAPPCHLCLGEAAAHGLALRLRQHS